MSRSQSTPAAPKPRFSFGTTNTSATGPKKVDMLFMMMMIISKSKYENWQMMGIITRTNMMQIMGIVKRTIMTMLAFDQVPMNRVVVGTAPSPNLTVSQAR